LINKDPHCTSRDEFNRKKENSSDINLSDKLKSVESSYFRVKFNENENNFFIYDKAHSLFSDNLSSHIKQFKFLNEEEIEDINLFLHEFFTNEELIIKKNNFLGEGLKIEALIDELYESYEDKGFSLIDNTKCRVINYTSQNSNVLGFTEKASFVKQYLRSNSEKVKDFNLKFQEDMKPIRKTPNVSRKGEVLNTIEKLNYHKYLSENNIISNKSNNKEKMQISGQFPTQGNNFQNDLQKNSSIKLYTNYSSISLNTQSSNLKCNNLKKYFYFWHITNK